MTERLIESVKRPGAPVKRIETMKPPNDNQTIVAER